MVTFGLKASVQFTDVDTLRRTWVAAEDGGFDHCWIFDHFAPLGPVRRGDVFEAWTLLGALAQATSRIRFGTLVTGNTHRAPAFLAKMAATVDHLSGGRLEFGFGAGGDDVVDAMMGRPLRPPAERIARWDEACEILRLLWTQSTVDYAGKHYTLTAATSDPKPLAPLRMWLGSNGEKLGLRVVARHADVWVSASMPGTPVAEMARISAVLDRHCEAIDRDPATVRRASQFWVPDSYDGTARLVQEHLAAGFTDLVFMRRADDPVESADHLAGWLPRLRDIG
jgi:alkanesulfonate monooxygenase SsuD/methylene tetrahydromethanopterin reductase-like flavin-dependent oxidoreductase (luciferase family)